MCVFMKYLVTMTRGRICHTNENTTVFLFPKRAGFYLTKAGRGYSGVKTNTPH